jgi:hypothetical protein
MAVVWRYTPPKVNAAALLAAVAPEATKAAADHLLQASQPLVPVETGELRDSGEVRQEGSKAIVSYDAVAEDGFPYGIRQHEDLSLHHPNGGQAKFLEQPMHTEADAMRGIVAAKVAEALHL